MAIKDLLSNSIMGEVTPSNELFGILNDPNVTPQQREQARRVIGLENRVRQAGLDPSLTEPRTSFFGELLDTLDAPRQGVAGIIDAALRGDIFTPEVGTGFRRGQQQNITTSDILERQGLQNPIARGILGFAGDILTDPLTYLSFGTTKAAQGAGKVLTESGQLLRNDISKRILDTGLTDFAQHGYQLDDTLKAIDRYQIHAERFKKAAIPSEKALEADLMTKAASTFGKYVDESEVATKSIFEKPKLRIGASIPFLGHFQEEQKLAVETLQKDPGPIGQAFRIAGEVFKPGKLKIAEFDIAPSVLNAMDNIKLFANNRLGEVASAVGKLEEVPILGKAVTASKNFTNKVTKAMSTANRMFRDIFYQKSLIGANANNNRLNFINVREGNRAKAIERTMDIIGEHNLQNPALLKEAYLAVDALAMDAMRNTTTDKSALSAINNFVSKPNITANDDLILRGALEKAGTNGLNADQEFRSGLSKFISNPDIDPNLKDVVNRVISGMDELAIHEADNGIRYSFLEHYIPHRYQNLSKAESKIFKGNSIVPGFTKERKYETISDAFKAKGYVADADLISVLRSRIERGLNKISENQYSHRVMIEEGLDVDLIKNVYKEALLDPMGPAAKVLKRYRIDFDPAKVALMKEGEAQVAYQNAVKGILDDQPGAAAVLAQRGAEMSQKTREELWSSGFRPLDNELPDSLLNELGKIVKIPGEKDRILPHPIARSLEETIAAKDILRDTVGQTEFGKAMLGALDHTSAFFKKFTTLPWPGYWGQNFLGDRFRQVMAGAEASNPGIFARTHSLLKGDSVITTPYGMHIDKESLERVMKDMGLNYTANDYLGTVKSFSDMNIDAWLARHNSLTSNLLSTKKGTKIAALRQVHDKMQKSFDGFFRASHLVHRLETGDTLPDAVRSAQDIYFNYRDMSPVEQSFFRRFYMFYGYMSKATKSSVSDLLTAPGNLTKQLHGVNALAEMFSDPNAAPDLDSRDYKMLSSVVNNEQISRVIGRSKNGQPIVASGFGAPLNAVMQQIALQTPRNFTVSELLDTANDSARRTIQKQFATANPLINSAAQYVTGKNLFFDKPLSAEFLRKLPDFTKAAEALAGFSHNSLPITINDDVKKFIKAVPDGKGRLIADPGWFWIFTNILPGIGRLNSTLASFTNQDLNVKQALTRFVTGVNIRDSDVSRSYLATRREELDKFIEENSVNQRIRNIRDSQ